MIGTELSRVYNIALFGATGSGKSSIINLLADKNVANMSPGAEVCTRRARWYSISLGEKKYRLWDTMGFNQAEVDDTDPLSPYEQAHTLFRNLPNGIDLILLCARKDGINASLRKLYWLLDSFFWGGRVQIALVLTHFDTLPKEHRLGWWDRNKITIAQKCNIPVQHIPHACITTVHNGPPQSDPLYQQSKQELEVLLEEVDGATPIPLPPNFSSSDAAQAADGLSTYCRMSISNASALVQKFRLPQRPFNVVLFGESGAGKSSVINLLAEGPVAKVSDDINSCTMDFSSYEINAGLHKFLVWDTVGHNGTHIEHDMCLEAIRNSVRLVRSLHNKGGVDLLIFCKRSGRLQQSELNNFRLFHEFLCEGQIPVAFVITHLESLTPMEKWWETNGDDLLKGFNLKPGAMAGHACITSAALDDPNDQRLLDKLSLSRQSVQAVLEDSISYGSALNKEEGAWVMAFLKKLIGTMVKAGNLPRRGRIGVKNLMDRCGLTKEHAEELINLLYARS